MASIRGTFCERKMKPKGAFDPRSFRWKKSGRAWLLVGCPKRHWKAKTGRCAVGTEAHALLTPARGRCTAGSRKIRKGKGLEGGPANWWIPRPPRPKLCYRSKSAALRDFVDANHGLISGRGLDYPSPPEAFDAINRKYGLKGKRAAKSIADAIWEAMPKGRPFCLDRIDIDTLNEIDLVKMDDQGRSFQLPDHAHNLILDAQQKLYWERQR